MSIFDHPPIIGWTKRPYANVDEMNDIIVEVWNKTIGKNDEVHIAGDFAFKRHGRWCNALNGKKVLVLGNHDGMNKEALAGLSDALSQTDVKAIQQFRRVLPLVEYTYLGQMIALSHYWLGTWDGMFDGGWNLHSHVHGRRRESLPGQVGHNGLWLDVGWDVHKRPIAFEEIDKMMLDKIALMPQGFQERAMENRRKYRKEGAMT